MVKNLHKIESNLYRGGAPSLRDVVGLNKKLGVNKIISLDERTGKYIEPLCQKMDIEQLIIPIHPGQINSLKSLLKYNIHDLFDKNKNTFIHCLHGKDRTGLLVALYRCIVDDWDCKKAIKEAKYLGFGTGLNASSEKFYMKLICLACKKEHKDTNGAYDIVNNIHEYDVTLDKDEQESFAPSIGEPSMRQYPYANVYRYYDEQYPDRENYGLKGINREESNLEQIPMVGVYDENTQVANMVGPSTIGGGFV